MTLEELGKEYLNQAETLKQLISGYSARAKSLGGIELYEMNSKITVLREMERDIRIIGKQLTGYYTEKPEKKPYKRHCTIQQNSFSNSRN